MKTAIVWRLHQVGLSLSLVGVALAGCNGEGLSRHQVSGAVTYKGEALELGAVVFEPDVSVGKLAPTGRARVENGQFKTPFDQSPIAGAYHVRVMGFDKSRIKKNPAPGEIIEVPDLFPEYTLQVQIPPPNGRLDIDVPEKRADSRTR